ncbi:MAG: hypothetical protein WCP31_10550 [Chloroflexales bacterium]
MSHQPALNLDQLLQTAAATAHDGNRAAARAIFLALGREYPDEARVWTGLATVAADPAEQQMALERARKLATLGGTSADAEPIAFTVAPRPSSLTDPARTLPPDAAVEAARTPFPLLNIGALLVILLLLAAVGMTIGRNFGAPAPSAVAPTDTPLLAVIPDPSVPTVRPAPFTATAEVTAVSTEAPSLAVSTNPTVVPSTMPSPTLVTAAPTLAAPVPSPMVATAAPTLAPVTPSAVTALPLGQIIDYDGWSATLLRPDYAMTLTGPIGDLRPTGQFVLAVIAISNNSPTARTIPASLFTLTDSTNQSYAPVPGVSTAYLALYERGQRGDLALEDALDPGSGMRSVPIIFDVPLTVSGLRLTMTGTAGAGWPIGGAAPITVGP